MKLSIVIINEQNNPQILQECIASIKKQQVKDAKAVMVGGEYTKSELLNKGLELISVSDYVMFINSYEELKEGYIEKCFKIFEKYPVGAVYTDYDKAYLANIRECLPSFSRIKITQGWLIPTTAMYKREVFDACGNFDSSLSMLENWDMWMRLSEKYPLYHIPESLYLTKGNTDDKISNEKLLENKRYILEKANARKNGK